jgi:hypothetical protein
MAKQIELSALKGQRMKFTAYFDDYVPYGGNSMTCPPKTDPDFKLEIW